MNAIYSYLLILVLSVNLDFTCSERFNGKIREKRAAQNDALSQEILKLINDFEKTQSPNTQYSRPNPQLTTIYSQSYTPPQNQYYNYNYGYNNKLPTGFNRPTQTQFYNGFTPNRPSSLPQNQNNKPTSGGPNDPIIIEIELPPENKKGNIPYRPVNTMIPQSAQIYDIHIQPLIIPPSNKFHNNRQQLLSPDITTVNNDNPPNPPNRYDNNAPPLPPPRNHNDNDAPSPLPPPDHYDNGVPPPPPPPRNRNDDGVPPPPPPQRFNDEQGVYGDSDSPDFSRSPQGHGHGPPWKRGQQEDVTYEVEDRRGPPPNRGPPANRGPPPNRGPPANRAPPPNRGPPANKGPNRGQPDIVVQPEDPQRPIKEVETSNNNENTNTRLPITTPNMNYLYNSPNGGQGIPLANNENIGTFKPTVRPNVPFFQVVPVTPES